MLAAIADPGQEGPDERLLLSDVLPIAAELAADLRAEEASDAVEVAGSVRRWAETCKDVDLIATATDPIALGRALLEHPLAAAKGSAGEGGARITTHNGVPWICESWRRRPTATSCSTSRDRPSTTSRFASGRSA